MTNLAAAKFHLFLTEVYDELFFLLVLILIWQRRQARAVRGIRASGAAILTIVLAAIAGCFAAGDSSAYFHSVAHMNGFQLGCEPQGRLLGGRTRHPNRHSVVHFYGHHASAIKNCEDLLVPAQLFGPVPGGLGISVVFVGALLAATTGIVGATVVAMGMISLPAMLRSNVPVPCDRDNCGLRHIGANHSALNRFDHSSGPVGLCHGPSLNRT